VGETLEERYGDFFSTASFLSSLSLTRYWKIVLFEDFLESTFIHFGVPLSSTRECRRHTNSFCNCERKSINAPTYY
jgi:hypothetical protein